MKDFRAMAEDSVLGTDSEPHWSCHLSSLNSEDRGWQHSSLRKTEPRQLITLPCNHSQEAKRGESYVHLSVLVSLSLGPQPMG